MPKKKNKTNEYKIIPSKDELLTKEIVRFWILNNDEAVKRAAVIIYDQQTDEEKNDGVSLYENDIGFNRYDSKFLSDFAIRCKLKKNIKPKQIIEARYKVLKYSGQVAKITNNKKDIQLQWDLGIN